MHCTTSSSLLDVHAHNNSSSSDWDSWQECRGKRVGVFGSFLLAIHNADEDEYQTICKIGTGFSEELLLQLSEQLRDKKIDGPRPYYRSVPA